MDTKKSLKPLQELNAKAASILEKFYESYMKAAKQGGLAADQGQQLFDQLIACVVQTVQNPYHFNIFHQSIRTPFDFYQFGLNFIRPLIDFQKSKIFGIENVKSISQQLSKNENVILLANHQTEPDPQIINLLLMEHGFEELASKMIFVAGHRVIEDPLAIPMSMGCNLLCIYSKKHMDNPPEEKPKKLAHNQRTMKQMAELLSEGGKCIYVAPSGGRDRPDSKGKIFPEHLNASSIEMFWLMAQQATQPTHFYPLALKTYSLMPPPFKVEKELGEKREANYIPVYLSFGAEISMENIPGIDSLTKREIREKRAKFIENLMLEQYQLL